MQLIRKLLRLNSSRFARSANRGLSTAELVGIIVIVGILGAIGGTYVNGLVTQANTNAGRQNASTLNTLAASVLAAGATVGTVDFFDELLGAREATPEDWKKWTKKGIDFKHFEGDTHDPKIQDAVSTHFEDGIDWLFIDANHEYEHVLQDFTDYGAMVNEGGVIVLHDVRPKDMGSSRLFEELRQAGYVTQLLVADPYSETVDAGIGIIYV